MKDGASVEEFRGKPRLWMVVVGALWVQFAFDPRTARLIVPVAGTLFALAELAVRTRISDDRVTTSQFGRTLRSVPLAEIASVNAGRPPGKASFWASGPPLLVSLNDGTTVLFPWLRGRADVAGAIEARLGSPGV